MDYIIADKLIALRKKSGLSQDELADKLSISRQAISKWERSESLPDTENLIALSKLYSVSLDDLVNNNVQRTQVPSDNNATTNQTVNQNANVASQNNNASTAKKLNVKKLIFLIAGLVGFVVMIVCLALTGYFIAELIEIHQPGFIFEPGDTLYSERIGYAIALAISTLFAIGGLVAGIVLTIKSVKQKSFLLNT